LADLHKRYSAIQTSKQRDNQAVACSYDSLKTFDLQAKYFHQLDMALLAAILAW
jgi:hypothetical protein